MSRTKTLVGEFDGNDRAQQVMRTLMNAGFAQDEVRVVPNARLDERYETRATVTGEERQARSAARGAILGAVIGAFAGLLYGMIGAGIPGFRWALTAGPFISTLVGLLAGAAIGGLSAGMMNTGIPAKDPRAETLAHPHHEALVMVRVADEQAERVAFIMREHGVLDIEERADTGAGGSGDERAYEPRVIERAERPLPETAPPGAAETGSEARAFAPELAFRTHYNIRYAASGVRYEDYAKAYHYGYLLAQDPRHAQHGWHAVAEQVRRDWEREQPGSWQRYRDAVRYGWGKVRAQEYRGPERRQAPRGEYQQYVW